MSQVSTVLTAWAEAGNKQVDFVKATGLDRADVSRIFNGDHRPTLTKFAQILRALQFEHPELARQLLIAYLRDEIPEGNAPTGRPWAEHVAVEVEPFSARIEENQTVDELELALSYITNLARTTKHGRQYVLGFYHIKHPEKAASYRKK